jgi:hypothetical protein
VHGEIWRGRPPLDGLDAKILAVADKSPFESSLSIAKRPIVSYSIVLQHLHESIGFKSFDLHRVPHLLTVELREKRKEFARAMWSFLPAAERDGWRHLMTGDESWFLLNTSPRRMWTLSRDDMITKPRLDIQSKKVYVSDHVESQPFLCCRQSPK